jgi:hypothetical protein
MSTLKCWICTLLAAFFCLAILPRPLLAAEAPALSEEQAIRELARDLASIQDLVVAAELAPKIAKHVVVHGIRSDSSRSDSSFFLDIISTEYHIRVIPGRTETENWSLAMLTSSGVFYDVHSDGRLDLYHKPYFDGKAIEYKELVEQTSNALGSYIYHLTKVAELLGIK